jgi:2-polyprenyl-6-methoxyphenol hydroxylase-like FAD-dependent oxidoreductase
MNPYDVIVVGGRVAGAATAMLLARSGARVVLLDRGRYGSDTVSTHALMRAGVMQLSRWGLLHTVVASGAPPVRRTLFHYADGETVQVSIRPYGGVDALYAPRRNVLDAVLVDAAAAAGVEVRHGTAVTGLLRDRYSRVHGVRAVDGAGRRFELCAPVTIGADGIRSVVADQVDAPVVRQGSHAGAVLYRYLTELPVAGYEWAWGGGAAAGLVPTNDGATLAFVSTTPERMRTLRRLGQEEALVTLLEQVSPDLAARASGAQPEGRIHGWAGVPGHVRRSWGPGWALVGDAGYFKDPITAHGITDALRDAELLAGAVHEVLADGVPECVALSRYQRTRDRLSAWLFEVTEAVAGYDWDTERIRHLLRQVSAAMTDEVEHLQALPDRRIGAGLSTIIPTDTAPMPG